MMIPLAFLAIGAVVAGFLNWPKHSFGDFLHASPSIAAAELVAQARFEHVNPTHFGRHEPGGHIFHTIMLISALVSAAGILLAYQFHLKDRPRGDALPQRFPALSRLLEAKYHVDEIYQAAIVEPLRSLGKLFFAIDRTVVDGLVWAIGFIPQLFGFSLKLTTQRGSLQGYALLMLLGIAAILLVMFM
jgi:NADH:ubiquinone oxidoreductase subunit 5 (subunit L)/multisubunit Na+/H+ antiporter MnhA subunit